MRIVISVLLFFYLTISFVYAQFNSDKDWINKADATADIINNSGEKIGSVYAKQATHGVLLRVNINNLPEGIHGMHFHDVGNCSDHEYFKSAGEHINPQNKPHGFLNPQGPQEANLPNLIVNEQGKAEVELYTQLVSIRDGDIQLLDINGSSLVIHSSIDDYMSDPTGGAGTRIACGIFIGINH